MIELLFLLFYMSEGLQSGEEPVINRVDSNRLPAIRNRYGLLALSLATAFNNVEGRNVIQLPPSTDRKKLDVIGKVETPFTVRSVRDYSGRPLETTVTSFVTAADNVTGVSVIPITPAAKEPVQPQQPL